MEKQTLIVFSTGNSSRLDFILQWLFKEIYAIDYRLVHNESALTDLPFFISYGKVFPNALSIPDAGLLRQRGINDQDINIGSWNDIPTIYANNAQGYSLPFDLFSAIFFLLSRYEEYYSYRPDKHGRYPAKESILYKNGWLQRPIVDEWVLALKQLLQQKATAIKNTDFEYQPTYDIDIAYSYLNKGKKRIQGAQLRDLLKGKISSVIERKQVLEGKLKDPYDSYDFITTAHNKTKPIYFILAALNTTDYDKNILPDTMEMHRLIKRLQKTGPIYLHPSYYSNEGDTLRREKHLMEVITGETISSSRQHYIKLVFPATYKILLANGINHDYSMGYGSHLGFRAGTGRSFYWYDLLNESVADLRITPFCFMDTTAFFEEKLSVSEAFRALRYMTEKLKKTGSRLTTIFHNFSLGTEAQWAGWKDAYGHFLKEVQG